MKTPAKKTDSQFLFKGQKKEFLDWLGSLRISKYWLDTLNYADSYALCNEILHVLENFGDLDLVGKEKLFALTEIDACLKDLCQQLHNSYFYSKFPLTVTLQNNVDVVINTQFVLAKAYYEIVDNQQGKTHKLSEQLVVLNTCKGLQALGLVFLTAVTAYKEPPAGFWLLCYRLFQVAESSGLLDHKVKIDDGIYSVALLFKQLLVFHILGINYLIPQEIVKVFEWLIRGINYVQNYVHTNQDASTEISLTVTVFHLDKDQPPQIQRDVPVATAKLLRYLDMTEVAKIVQFLQHEAQLHPEENFPHAEAFADMLKNLGQQPSKNKRYTAIVAKHDCRVILGLDNLVNFLLEKEGRAEASSTPPIKEHEFSSIEEEFDSLQMILDWDAQENPVDQSSFIEGLEILDSSIDGYTVLWTTERKQMLQIGEAIGVIPDFSASAKKIEIGLIEKISYTEQGLIFTIRLIGLHATLIYTEREQDLAGEWVIFLFGSPNYDVSILCSKKSGYRTNDQVFVQLRDRKTPCELGQIYHATASVTHIALTYKTNH